MTDTAFEKMLHDALPDADLPDSLSKEKVLASLQNVEPIRPVYGIKRYIAAAAAIVILLGVSSVLYASGFFSHREKNDMFSPTADEFVEATEPSMANGAMGADEPKENFSAYNAAKSEADSVSPSSQESLFYNEEILLEKGDSREITLPFEFGNETEICYYDVAGSRTDEPCCSVDVSDGIVSITGTSEGETVVEFSNGTDICTIKVYVSEGGF